MKTSPELNILRGIAIVFVLASTTLANGADGTIHLDFKNQGLSANIENIPIKIVIKKITKKKKMRTVKEEILAPADLLIFLRSQSHQ